MILWRVYYADGSTFDNYQGTPLQVPAYGVICILYRDEVVERIISHRRDFYYWVPTGSQWWGSDSFGMLDQMSLRGLVSRDGDQWFYLHHDRRMEREPLIYRLIDDGYVKLGRSVSNTTFREIMERAHADPDFPRTSSKPQREHA